MAAMGRGGDSSWREVQERILARILTPFPVQIQLLFAKQDGRVRR
jgi:hypothetical protein